MTNLEKMWGIDVQNEEVFLSFLFEQAPENSYWKIELHCLQSEDEAFLSQLGKSTNMDNISELLIPLIEIVRLKLISKVQEIGGLIHHRIDANGEPFMISYDSFSSCWLSKKISQSVIDDMVHKGIFLVNQNK
ncbi:MAG: hypothetical protein AAGG00_08620 [Cyanobacteria bacterium P01_H01_bin.150]